MENFKNIIDNNFNGFESREDLIRESKERETSVTIKEEQKTFIWTRIYLKDEDNSLKSGDKIFMKYTPSGEVLETTFGAYGKENSFKDNDENVIQEYVPEDDLKTLCVAVDIDWINNFNNDIPFIRTLFKQSRFYEFQLLKFNELKIYSESKEFEYHSIDF